MQAAAVQKIIRGIESIFSEFIQGMESNERIYAHRELGRRIVQVVIDHATEPEKRE